MRCTSVTRAAGILPADASEQSTAGKMPAAPLRRRLTSCRFMVAMHGRQAKRAFHEPTHLRPLPGGEQAFVGVLSVQGCRGMIGRTCVSFAAFTASRRAGGANPQRLIVVEGCGAVGGFLFHRL